ncbi:hypothetical protein MYA98_02915 [Salmonella sp. WGH-01]|nr:hypothetical protein MYA98_02915 [Salmonella sp. WGH-01]
MPESAQRWANQVRQKTKSLTKKNKTPVLETGVFSDRHFELPIVVSQTM